MVMRVEEHEMKARLASLELRLAETELRLKAHLRTERRVPVATLPVRPVRTSEPPVPRVPQASRPDRPEADRSRAQLPPRESLSDLLGGRVLAWLGGVATLLGIVLFLLLAVSRGWIGAPVRVALATVVSAALVAAGSWLHERVPRNEAALAATGAGLAGVFATLVLAAPVYGLVAPSLALPLAMAVGALATLLSIRWNARVLAAIGLLGALASPLALVSTPGAESLVLLALAAGCSIVVAWRRRWGWLAVSAMLIAAPQWLQWLNDSSSSAAAVAVLVLFGGLGLAGVLAAGLPGAGHRRGFWPVGAVALATVNAALIAAVGRAALPGAAGLLWIAGVGGVHAVLALSRSPRVPVAEPLRDWLLALAVVLADVAFGLAFEGPVLAVGWGAAAVGFAALLRRRKGSISPAEPAGDEDSEAGLLMGGLGAHIALVLIRTLIDAPPGQGSSAGVLSVGVLAGTCVGAAVMLASAAPEGEAPVRRWFAAGLFGLGLVAFAYLTSLELSGAILVAAWGAEATALLAIGRRGDEPLALAGAAGFGALAAAHVLIVEAPPTALLTGAPSLLSAAGALGSLALAAAGAARSAPSGSDPRRWGAGAAAVTLVYMASVAIITIFQPAVGTVGDSVLDLSVRQQGQALLSAGWGLAGLAGLLLGLRRNLSRLRIASLGLLLAAVAKVFLYDLSTLTSIYRVGSFIVLGLLLLIGAFAHARLRPAAGAHHGAVAGEAGS